MITGTLDLRFAKCGGTLTLNNCRLSERPLMAQARLPELSLQGSHFPGLFAQGAKVTGSVFLRGATATGTVAVNSAQIGGQLACEGATLNGDGEDGTGMALHAQNLLVVASFLFRAVASVTGRVDLTGAHVGALTDDATSWAKCADILLDGFTYDRISGTAAPKSYAARRDWLAKGSRFEGEFFPQPYTQFARVMRAVGHAAEARRALMERDRLLFAAADKADRAACRSAARRGDSGRIWLRAFGRRLWSGLSRRVVGYGHRPEYALFWALGATLVGMVWYFIAWRAGVMVPNSAVILTSPDWLAAMQAAENAPTLTWVTMPPGQHYETFYALPYALDVFVPLVSLGEDQAWAASTVTWLGWVTRWVGFGFQIMGWVVTSLGIAAVTGFVQRNAPD